MIQLQYTKIFGYYFTSFHIKRHIRSISVQSAQANISLTDLNKFNILIPSLSEQIQIAKILSEVDAKIEKEEATKAEMEQLKKGLMQILLTGKVRVKA